MRNLIFASVIFVVAGCEKDDEGPHSVVQKSVQFEYIDSAKGTTAFSSSSLYRPTYVTYARAFDNYDPYKRVFPEALDYDQPYIEYTYFSAFGEGSDIMQTILKDTIVYRLTATVSDTFYIIKGTDDAVRFFLNRQLVKQISAKETEIPKITISR